MTFQQLVHLLDDLSHRCQLTHEFGTLHLLHVKGGLDRAVVTQFGGIHMPAVVNGGVEDDLSLCPLTQSQLGVEVHGINHLGMNAQNDHQGYEYNKNFLHVAAIRSAGRYR